MRIQEEVTYGEASSRMETVHPFSSFALRASSSTAGSGLIHLGGRSRHLQISLPMLVYDRYNITWPDTGSGLRMARAQRQFWDTMFERKFTPPDDGSHPGCSEGDLKSWNLTMYGPNAKDSVRAKGGKGIGFTISSQKRGTVNILQLAMQYQVADAEAETYSVEPEDELYPDTLYNHYLLEASQIRISPIASPVTDDMENTIVNEATGLAISMSRNKPSHHPQSAAVGGNVTLLEPFLGGREIWRIKLQAPTFDSTDHAVAQSLVDAMRTPASDRGRYDLRIDLGGVAGTVYKSMNMTEAVLQELWGYTEPHDPNGSGPSSARAYKLLSRNLAADGSNVSDYLPTNGNTMRWQGWNGGVGVSEPGQDGGYVARIAESKEYLDGPFPIVSFYFQDGNQLHTLEPDNEQLVPGGMSFHSSGVILTGTEGPGNNESAQSFTFASDSKTTVEVVY